MNTMKRIGIIGTGWGARVQIPAFRAAGFEVVALAGSQVEKTRHIAHELDVPWSTADWRTLLAQDIALVSIVTPPNLHCEMAIAALESGKHVLCEKPTALNEAEAQQMLNAAQANSQLLTLIDHELRFLPIWQVARQLVAAGKLGDIRYAEIRTVSSNRSDSQRPWNWWSDTTQGGGALGAIGSHQIDLLRYLLNDEVVAVQGFINTFITERSHEKTRETMPVTADDFSAFHLRFSRGSTAFAVANLVVRINEPNSLILYGAEQTLKVSNGQLLLITPDGKICDITPSHTVSFPTDINGDFAQGTVYLGHALSAALEGNHSMIAPAATFVDGLRIQQVIDAVRVSNNQGWVSLGQG